MTKISEKYLIKEITQKQIWEDFLLKCEQKTFLNSWSWGEFQEKLRGKVWRFGVYQKEVLISVVLVVKIPAKRATFLLIPHGPVVSDKISHNNKQILEALLKELTNISKQEKISFIRINPIWERNEENNLIFSDLGFRKAPLQTHPEASWKLDITLSEEELLTNMRKTTRYLIRQTLKNSDIKAEQSKKIEDIAIFSKMHEQVSKRQHFIPFSIEYLKNEFSTFQKDDQIVLFFAKYKGEVAAAAFVIFWSGIGFYHHAASLPQYAKFSMPYLLQWEAIKEAKKRGCKAYDFWGFVDPKKEPYHPWSGPTLFKMGFGGYKNEYVKAQDLVLSYKYWINYIIEKIRKRKRRL